MAQDAGVFSVPQELLTSDFWRNAGPLLNSFPAGTGARHGGFARPWKPRMALCKKSVTPPSGDPSMQLRGESTVTGKIFSPLLLLLAKLTESELLHTIQFLKAENEMLRSRLPRSVRTTPAERSRLLKLTEPLGNAVKELISIVTFRTFQRWRSDAKKTTRKPKKRKRGRPRKPEEIRQLVVRMAREDGWGYTRILGELRKLRITSICRNTVKNILKEHGFDLGPKRGEGTWDEFLKMHLKTLWACDFLTKEVWTLHGKVTYYILFFIEVATRRIHIAGYRRNDGGQVPVRRGDVDGLDQNDGAYHRYRNPWSTGSRCLDRVRLGRSSPWRQGRSAN